MWQILIGTDSKWERQRHFKNATEFKNICQEIRALYAEKSSGFGSSAQGAHFSPAPKFSGSKGIIIKKKKNPNKTSCSKGFRLVTHLQMLVHQKRNAVRLSPKPNSEVAALELLG